MADTTITLPSANTQARRYHGGSIPECTSAVRVFRIYHNRVALQIRAAKSYSTASLPLAELDQMIAALQAAREEIA